VSNLLLVNPMASLIDLYRSVLMEGTAPALGQWLIVVGESLAILALMDLGLQGTALLDCPPRGDPMSALLTLENVGMHFAVRPDHESGQHTVFEGINLTLNEGDRLGIVGRNGAGKSTLLAHHGQDLCTGHWHRDLGAGCDGVAVEFGARL
jgi:ABC-type multidrug transport system fused ATPase/permease subunit